MTGQSERMAHNRFGLQIRNLNSKISDHMPQKTWTRPVCDFMSSESANWGLIWGWETLISQWELEKYFTTKWLKSSWAEIVKSGFTSGSNIINITALICLFYTQLVCLRALRCSCSLCASLRLFLRSSSSLIGCCWNHLSSKSLTFSHYRTLFL